MVENQISGIRIKTEIYKSFLHSLYSEVPRKNGIRGKVGDGVNSISQMEEAFSILRLAVTLLDMIYSFIDHEYRIIFNFIKESKRT